MRKSEQLSIVWPQHSELSECLFNLINFGQKPNIFRTNWGPFSERKFYTIDIQDRCESFIKGAFSGSQTGMKSC